MGPFGGISAPLLLLLLTACVASYPAERAAEPGRPAVDLLLTQGQMRFAEARLRDFGFDPGPVDGDFTAETETAIRAFQRRYGIVASGLLDRATREELKLGVDPKRTD